MTRAPRRRRRRDARRSRRTRIAAKLRTLAFPAVSSLLVAGLIVGIAALQAFVSQGAFRMKELNARTGSLREDVRELQLEVAELSSPGRIAEEARRLGFRLPSDVKLLYVNGLPTRGAGDEATGDPSFALKAAMEQTP